MLNLARHLLHDDAGFVVSAELVLIATISVLGLVVGLTEVSNGVNQELEDVGAAFGSINQSFRMQGLTSCKARMVGSSFKDHADECDNENDISCNLGPQAESTGHSY